MVCHYLDIVVIMAAAAWLLNRLLPRPGIGSALAVPGTGEREHERFFVAHGAATRLL